MRNKVIHENESSKQALKTCQQLGGRHSTAVAFSLRTQPSRVRIWLLEKSNQEEKCFFREPAVLKLFGVSALGKTKKKTVLTWVRFPVVD